MPAAIVAALLMQTTAPEPAPKWVPPIVHGAALFTVMRTTEAFLWPDPFAETRLSVIGAHYRDAYTKPPIFDPKRRAFEWDGDPWYVNAIGHGLLGSELYLRARSCHFGWAGSLAFTAGASVVWEYVFEANGVRPSALDLIYTPLAGLVFGEARFLGHRAAGAIGNRTGRQIVQAILDPFGELERALGAGC